MCNKTKTCRTCEKTKDVCDFSWSKSKAGSPVYRYECKLCSSETRRKERVDHPDRSKAKWAKVKADPALFAKAQAKDKAYRGLHADEIRATARDYAKEHRDERRVYGRERNAKLKEQCTTDPEFYKKFRASRNAQFKKWLDRNPDQKLAMRLRSQMSRLFRKQLYTFEIMGCTRDEFFAWIEFQLEDTPELTVANYGVVWHLDHVRPCASFDLASEEEQRGCFHWSNIQPLDGLENISKNDKIMVDHLIRQLNRYCTYLEKHNKEDSIYDINESYKELLDGASPTTPTAKAMTGIRGNDLGHGKNGEDWAIRSQGALLERVTRLEEKLDICQALLLQVIDQLQRA